MKKIYFFLLLCFSTGAFADEVACPTASIAYAFGTFCSNSPIQPVLLSGTDNYTGGTFTSTAGLLINASTGAINPSQSTPGVYVITYTIPPDPGCPSVMATTTVVILQVPVATISGNQSVCFGNTAMVTFSGTQNTTVTYTVNGGPSQNISLGASGNATLMTSPLTVNTTYNLVSASTSGGCTNMLSGAATIIVNQTPTVTANISNTTICSGQTTNIVLSSNVPNTTFSWHVMQNNVMGCASGSGNSINQTLSAIGFNSGNVTYTITPSVDGCTGTPITVTITVYPNPDVIGNTSFDICSGDTTSIIISSSQTGVVYNWTANEAGAIGASAGTNNTTGIIEQTLYATGAYPGMVVYTVTPTLNGCQGNPMTFTVTVHPTMINNIPDGSICMDGNTNTALTSYVLETLLDNNIYDFTWYLNGTLLPDENNSSYQAVVPGEYMVTALNTINGCQTAPETVYVTAMTTATEMNIAESPQEDGNYSITVTVTGDGTYLYQLDNGELQTSNSFTQVPFGLHLVTVVDTNGCGNLTSTVDLPEIIISEDAGLVIGPNPVSDALTIQKNSTINKVTIQNQLGQTVMETYYNEKTISLDLSHLNAGIYFIRIDADKTEKYKILKN